MKKLILIATISFANLAWTQQSTDINAEDTGNVFLEAEKSKSNNQDDVLYQTYETDPGGPGDAPIDDYVPFLLVAAVGLIYYTYRRKRAIN